MSAANYCTPTGASCGRKRAAPAAPLSSPVSPSSLSPSREEQRKDEADQLATMKSLLDSIRNQVRLVELHQGEANSKLGFSLRGGKELTGSSVGVFVSHVEQRSEADRKGLKIGDQLIQVNGLNVNQATYDEVIGLIKRTPKSHDILLKVKNFGKIPFQEKSGDSIKWLQVLDLLEGQLMMASETGSREEPRRQESKLLDQVPAANGGLHSEHDDEEDEEEEDDEANSSSGVLPRLANSLSSDEGIESCESQRANSLSSGESDDSPDEPAPETGKSRNGQSKGGAHYRCGHDSSAPASCSLSLSINDTSSECCCSCSSACSLSISSLQSGSTSSSVGSGKAGNPSDEPPDTPVRVPGGRRTSEPFGCGVVKGPDEWPGIFVQNVKVGSLAERVGLQPGDQLVQADGQILDGLAFESAIALIKRLQKEQDELVLSVRKGAALRHLARGGPGGQLARRRQQEEATGAWSSESLAGQTNAGSSSGSSDGKRNEETQQAHSEARGSQTTTAPTTSCPPPADGNSISAHQSQMADQSARRALKARLEGKPSDRKVDMAQYNGDRDEGTAPTTTTTTRLGLAARRNASRMADVNMEMREQIRSCKPTAASELKQPEATTKKPLEAKANQLDRGHHQPAATASGRLDGLRVADNCGDERRLPSDRERKGTASAVSEPRARQVGSLEGGEKCVTLMLDENGNHRAFDAGRGAAKQHSLGQPTNLAPRPPPPAVRQCTKDIESETAGDDENELKSTATAGSLMASAQLMDPRGGQSRLGVPGPSGRVRPREGAGLGCGRRSYEDEDDDNDNDDEDYEEDSVRTPIEEIRIVSQNCKLHHYHHHGLNPLGFKAANLVKEKFTQLSHTALRPGTKLNQHQRGQTGQGETKLRESVAAGQAALTRSRLAQLAPRRRQAVAAAAADLEARRQLRGGNLGVALDNSSSALQLRGRHQLQRYVSVDDLCGTQHQRRLLAVPKRATRPAATLKGSASELRVPEVDYLTRTTAGEIELSPPQRLYRRSNSVLGPLAGGGSVAADTEATCCQQSARPWTRRCLRQCAGAALQERFGPAGSVLRPPSCCQQPARMHHSRKYSNTIGAPLALAKSKARSMDKLNVNLSLNYVRIGLTNNYQRTLRHPEDPSTCKQQQQKLHRSLLGSQRALATASDDHCCTGRYLPGSVFNNYATASRLISMQAACGGSNISRPATRCCLQVADASSEASCRQGAQTKIYRGNCFPQQQSLSGQSNKLPKNRATCCSLSPTPVYAVAPSTPPASSILSLAGSHQPPVCLATSRRSPQTAGYSPPGTCCSLLGDCCPLSSGEYHYEPLIGGTSGRLGKTRKYCTVAPPSGSAAASIMSNEAENSTDSSGYLSASERYHQSKTRENNSQNLQSQRLLRLRAIPQPAPPQAPPPPPMAGRQQAAFACPHSLPASLAGQRDTRQHLSTFRATAGCLVSPSPVPSNGGNGGGVARVSPTGDGSDLVKFRAACAQRGRAPAAPPGGATASSNVLARTPPVPCPPPMPAPDAEFECKIKGTLGQEFHLAKWQQQKQQQPPQPPQCEPATGFTLDGQREKTNNNRLCFVDELKMLAKRQQNYGKVAGSASASATAGPGASSLDPPVSGDSATLIKIINASKSSKACSCQRLEQASACAPCSVGSSEQGGQHANCRKQQQEISSDSKCARSSQKKSLHEGLKSVKRFDDEDSKRRQHEMLMKEFKYAHSKMFSKRRNAAKDEDDEEQHEQGREETSGNQPLASSSNNLEISPKRSSLGIGKEISLLAGQSPVHHLAAAN